ncbi:hypothetical protein [Desulfosporosinus sp. HMP52]|uniref:hypothetical protein n=1 Tax=Desulfosporosinus sp. HMP52 TaxID=1487923 RepID=UPI0013F3C612|nr:hypothetical protein [Desulfosporosinus sp. HMP52]
MINFNTPIAPLAFIFIDAVLKILVVFLIINTIRFSNIAIKALKIYVSKNNEV